jgi:hypothetical protein
MPRSFFYVLILPCVLLLAYLSSLLFFPPTEQEPDSPVQVNTRTDSAFETPIEKSVTLTDGRKLVCLQASYGALWCTPALDQTP